MISSCVEETRKFAKWTVRSNGLDTDSIADDLSLLLEPVVVGLDVLGESELSGDEDLLSTGELELGSSEGLLGVADVLGVGSHGHEDLSNVDSCGLQRGLPQACLIPCWSLSAPAQESILLILTVCQGWTLILMWKFSFPTLVCMYLLQAILEASRASEVICSFS